MDPADGQVLWDHVLDSHVVWKFDVVRGTGPARATWTNPKYPISGGAFWTSFTLDEPNGVLYVPAGIRHLISTPNEGPATPLYRFSHCARCDEWTDAGL